MILPTIKVDDGSGGFFTINQSDFDPAIHKPFGAAIAGPTIERLAPIGVPSREDIAAMDKVTAREWLEAHGAEPAKGRKVADLRADLERLMYIGDVNGD